MTTGNLSSIKTSVHSPHHQIRNLKMNLSLSRLLKQEKNFNTWRCPHNQTFHQKIDLRVQRGIGGLRPFVDIQDRRQTIGLLKWALKKMSFKRKLTAFFLWLSVENYPIFLNWFRNDRRRRVGHQLVPEIKTGIFSVSSIFDTKSLLYIFWQKLRCLKITEKVSFNNEVEANYVYILSRQKFIKNAKNCQFGEFLKCDFFVDFQTLCVHT